MNEFDKLDLIVICGGVRCFKTAHAVRLMKIAYDQGYEIYTNLELKGFWKYQYFHLDDSDPKKCLIQLQEIFRNIGENGLQKIPKFLFLDEFSDIVDSQNWKGATWTTSIWKQLGKMGFTTCVTNQTFSMTYNRYRENCNKKIITQRIDDKHYLVNILIQSSNDHEEYKLVARYGVDGSLVFDFYDTYQLMYSK